MSLTVAGVFSGIGGFTLAAERVGMRPLWECEIEPFQRRVLAARFPGVPLYDDVCALDPGSLERPDVLTGGFPCQDLSVAGKRAGLGGERSGLFWEIVRLADTLRPSWLVLENVPGLLSSNGGRDMATVVGALADLGYLGAWRVLDAQWFGVAQRRRRMFLVGCLGADRLAALLPFLTSGNRHPAPRRMSGEGASCGVIKGAAIGRQPHNGPLNCCETHAVALSPAQRGRPNDPHRADMAAYVPHVAACDTRREAKGPDSDVTTTLVAHTLTGNGFDASEDGTGRGTPLVAFGANRHAQDATEGLSPTIRCGGKGGGGVHTAVAISGCPTPKLGFDVNGSLRRDRDVSLAVPAQAFAENQRGELRMSNTHPALGQGGGKPGQGYPAAMHGSQVRRLTPTEAERLQGFPDGHTCLCGKNSGRSVGDDPCTCKDGPRYRALGNAVAVPCVEWILRQVAAAEANR